MMQRLQCLRQKAASPAASRRVLCRGIGGVPLDDLLQGKGSSATHSSEAGSYDLVVIGGGSGGIAAAREAAALGASVLLADYVQPSPHGTRWGLGGTCVNVGCIPKKIFHYAGALGDAFHDARELGWQLMPPRHDWDTLVAAVQNHIRSSNFGYRSALRQEGVEYVNSHAKFTPDGTIQLTSAKGDLREVKGDNTIIAVGGRPHVPHLPGAEHCITSDDLWTLPQPPGRTLVVGAGYVALECAGVLHSLGFPVSVMIRSHALRGFDRGVVGRLVDHMKAIGIEFLEYSVPEEFVSANGQVQVKWSDNSNSHTDTFDTVLMATGRRPSTLGLDLEYVGVKLDDKGKILPAPSGRFKESTDNERIFAVGDCLHATPELTPLAIQSGKNLVRNLVRGTNQAIDYTNVPTTVFTPLEYGCVGLTEEEAVALHGADGIEVFHAAYDTVEQAAVHRQSASGDFLSAQCYTKVVAMRAFPHAVLGLHVLGPHAGEVLQGFSVAFSMGLTWETLQRSCGIHPTHAEEVVDVHRTKRSGLSEVKTSC